jgi:Kef-type K+ transport system membrane component KefB
MAKIRDLYLEDTYQWLRITAYVIFGFAALTVIGGFYYFAKTNDFLPSLAYMYLAASIGFAFILSLIGQIALVLVSQEWNQRETNELLRQIISNQNENKE